MKAKEFIPAIKPRNFVAKNAQSSGAGRHQDSSKKKDQDQGKVKHKKDLVPMESAPKGWEGTVKAMKKHKDIDNPYALAWSMKNKGYKSHKKEGVAEGSEDLTPNMAKYVLDQIYNSNGAVTMTDLFDEGIPGLRDMFMATAEELGLDPDEDFMDVESAVLEKLEDLVKGGHGLDEAQSNDFRVGQRVIYKNSRGQQFPSIVTAVDFDEDAVKIKSANNKPFPNSGGDIEIVVDPGYKFLTPEPRVDPNSIIAVSPTMRKTTERVRDPEDWDEGNTEPGNNFAVYINGKKWKVFPGPAGAYADSPEEKRELQRLKGMAQRKSQETGKKWEVYVTGEPATR